MNTIKIDLKKEDDLVLVISDDGRGFDAKVKKNVGIRNMMSRTKECHGEFQIKSKEEGTIITIIIPIEQN
jgi:signal transduction histidine kinase